MSYCVGLKLNCGLVFMSDTLTNGGLDNISHYPKTFTWGVPDDRQIFLSTAGNLATSQAVISTLSEQNESSSEETPSILRAPSMFQVAQTVSKTLAEVIGVTAKEQMVADSTFSATFILGGQIKGSKMTLYLIYPEGNFIEVSEENPFFQIGETKYGRPILVRAFEPKMSFEDAVKLLMVSFDSTIKANLSVGLPLDLHIYDRDSILPAKSMKIERDNPYFNMVSHQWGEALKNSLAALPKFSLG
ncbi:MAG: peptidase [Candidatus Latescibacterota bacterium]|nr:peptidase [Candidatus Latescibacterota bacterium]